MSIVDKRISYPFKFYKFCEFRTIIREYAHGQRYQAAVNNPQTHEILDILPKRTTTEIIRYFSQYSREERMGYVNSFV